MPGALEIPTAIGIAERMSNFDGYVALGCVIRGETTHYETVCNDSARGLTLLGLQGLCIGNGILTVENRDQAEARADPDRMNKGAGAAAAALHLVALARKWGGPRKGVGFKPASEESALRATQGHDPAHDDHRPAAFGQSQTPDEIRRPALRRAGAVPDGAFAAILGRGAAPNSSNTVSAPRSRTASTWPRATRISFASWSRTR